MPLIYIQQYLNGTVKISFDDNKPHMIKEGKHYFARSTVSEDILERDQDLSDFLWKNFEKLDLKLKGVASDNSQVSTAYYSTKMKHPSKHGKHVIQEEEETESESPTTSDFQAFTDPDFQTPIIQSQLRVLNKTFVIDMVALFGEFKSVKNKEKRKSYHATFEQKEKAMLKENEKKKCTNYKNIYILEMIFKK